LFYPFDAEYVRRLRGGEPDVQEHFSLFFAERLQLKLRSRYQVADMEDIIQETLLRALLKIRDESLRQPESFGAFVFGICSRVCQEGVRVRKLEPLPEEHSPFLQNSDNQERDLIAAEQRRALLHALRGMEDKDRRMLTARFFEERPKEELCAEFGVSPSYLRVCLFRAKKTLKRRFLQKYDKHRKPNDEKKDH